MKFFTDEIQQRCFTVREILALNAPIDTAILGYLMPAAYLENNFEILQQQIVTLLVKVQFAYADAWLKEAELGRAIPTKATADVL